MNFETTPPLHPERSIALSGLRRCLEARIQMLRTRNVKRPIAEVNVMLRQIEEIILANGHSVFGALPGAQWRHHPLPAGQELILNIPGASATNRTVNTLDELSDAINLLDAHVFQCHVNAKRNDFADWVETRFGLPALAEKLRIYPTPLRMMVTIEKFLRLAEINY